MILYGCRTRGLKLLNMRRRSVDRRRLCVPVRAFQVEMERKKNNAQRVRERRSIGRQPAGDKHWVPAQTPLESPGNGELPLRGDRGAGAALRRLEEQEERAHAR